LEVLQNLLISEVVRNSALQGNNPAAQTAPGRLLDCLVVIVRLSVAWSSDYKSLANKNRPRTPQTENAMPSPIPPTATPLYPADNPAVTTHITLLQGIINRLAGNSSSCKTWCLSLVGALIGLTGATHNAAIVTFALVPVVIFGGVDTAYLAQERAYRVLYGEIVGKVRARTYELADALNARAALTFGGYFRALRSWSIWPVYGGLIGAYLVAAHYGWLDVLAAAPALSKP
jgi:hypothetical protein